MPMRGRTQPQPAPFLPLPRSPSPFPFDSRGLPKPGPCSSPSPIPSPGPGPKPGSIPCLWLPSWSSRRVCGSGALGIAASAAARSTLSDARHHSWSTLRCVVWIALKRCAWAKLPLLRSRRIELPYTFRLVLTAEIYGIFSRTFPTNGRNSSALRFFAVEERERRIGGWISFKFHAAAARGRV